MLVWLMVNVISGWNVRSSYRGRNSCEFLAYSCPSCQNVTKGDPLNWYRGADKSLARPGRKLVTAIEILSFIYPIYNHNWRNINTIYIYIYITRLASKEIFWPSNKTHQEVGRACLGCQNVTKEEDPLNWYRGADKSLARPVRKQVTATEDFDFHISYL